MNVAEKSKRPYVLIFSLVVNALLIGVLLGGSFAKRGDRGPSGPPHNAFELVRGLDQAVDVDDRRQVRATLRKAFAGTRPQRGAVHQAHKDLRAALTAEPYDPAAVRTAFETLNAAEMALKTSMHDVLATELERLTPEQRAALLAPQERHRRRPRTGKPRFQPGRD